MTIEHTKDNFPVLRVRNRRNKYRTALESCVSQPVVRFIEEWVNLNDTRDLVLLETSSSFNLVNIQPRPRSAKSGLATMINIKRINDIRYINKFLESANEELRIGGHLVGCVETSEMRRARLMKKYPWPLNLVYFFFDYWVKRVWPKLPYFKRFYFFLTAGRNRVISDMETIGRLYSCGFNLQSFKEIDGLCYFVAEKVGTPAYNEEATYGPLIKLQRVGKGGKVIKVYKLRTMYPYSEYLQGYVYEKYGLQKGGKIKDDPRVTGVGHIFRKYWIDELPMLINFFKGDMKLFGVRPISLHYLSLYPEEFQKYRQKFKPGLIPPVYVEIPETLEDVIDIEKRYLQAYERFGILTDIRYTCRALYNILFRKVRSN